MLLPKSQLRDVRGVSEVEKEQMKEYIQDAVCRWTKNQPEKQFAARDLFGGINSEWFGTPLYPLFEKHRDGKGKDEDKAITGAGVDVGWLLKSVLANDERYFLVGISGRTAGYKLKE